MSASRFSQLMQKIIRVDSVVSDPVVTENRVIDSSYFSKFKQAFYLDQPLPLMQDVTHYLQFDAAMLATLFPPQQDLLTNNEAMTSELPTHKAALEYVESKWLMDLYRIAEHPIEQKRLNQLYSGDSKNPVFCKEIASLFESFAVDDALKLYYIAYAHQGGFANSLASILPFALQQSFQAKLILDANNMCIRIKIRAGEIIYQEYQEIRSLYYAEIGGCRDIKEEDYYKSAEPQIILHKTITMSMMNGRPGISNVDARVYVTNHLHSELRQRMTNQFMHTPEHPLFKKALLMAAKRHLMHLTAHDADLTLLEAYKGLPASFKKEVLSVLPAEKVNLLRQLPYQLHFEEWGEESDLTLLSSIQKLSDPTNTNIILKMTDTTNQLVAYPLSAGVQRVIETALMTKEGKLSPYPSPHSLLENRHIVIPLPNAENPCIYMKVMPDQAIIYKGVEELTWRLFAEPLHATSRIGKLCLVTEEGMWSCPVQLSLAKPGITLEKQLSKSTKPLIDKQSFSQSVITSLLCRSGDASARNVMYQASGTLSVVDDTYFVKPLKRQFIGINIQLMSILFCFENMNDCLPEDMVKHLISINVDALMFHWITKLIQYEIGIKKLFSDDETTRFYESHPEYKFTPSATFPVGSISCLRHDLAKLITWLKNKPDYTKIRIDELFELLQPDVYSYFKAALKNTNQTPAERLQNVAKKQIQSMTSKASLVATLGFIPTNHQLMGYDAVQAAKELNFFNIFSFGVGNLQSNNSSSSATVDFALLNNPDGSVDIEREKLFLDVFMPNFTYTHLTLIGCHSLTETRLKNILSKSSALESLTINNCAIDIHSVMYVAVQCLALKQLSLKNLPYVPTLRNVISYTFLHLEKFSLLYAQNNPSLSRVNLHAPCLNSIEIENTPALNEVRSDSTHLRKLILKGCDRLAIAGIQIKSLLDTFFIDYRFSSTGNIGFGLYNNQQQVTINHPVFRSFPFLLAGVDWIQYTTPVMLDNLLNKLNSKLDARLIKEMSDEVKWQILNIIKKSLLIAKCANRIQASIINLVSDKVDTEKTVNFHEMTTVDRRSLYDRDGYRLTNKRKNLLSCYEFNCHLPMADLLDTEFCSSSDLIDTLTTPYVILSSKENYPNVKYLDGCDPQFDIQSIILLIIIGFQPDKSEKTKEYMTNKLNFVLKKMDLAPADYQPVFLLYLTTLAIASEIWQLPNPSRIDEAIIRYSKQIGKNKIENVHSIGDVHVLLNYFKSVSYFIFALGHTIDSLIVDTPPVIVGNVRNV
jgi:hypothetical protein